VLLGIGLVVPAAGQSKSDIKRIPWGGYGYPASYDAEIADPVVHRVLYEDADIMFLEVTNPPGFDVKMHGHPYASVFARDTGTVVGSTSLGATAGAEMTDTHLDPANIFNGKGWGQGPAPGGLSFPRCTTAPPESPHKPMNHGAVPVHFFRIEFRRLDGEELPNHWREWYPWILNGQKPINNPTPGEKQGSKLPGDWPYPPDYDSVFAAPNNYRLLYEDGHVRLLEVAVRPGETTPMHGHPYASVLAFNAVTNPATMTETWLDPKSPQNGQGSGHGPAPAILNMKVPTCVTTAPQAPHSIHNAGAAPLHYYRIEFKRVDGEDFKANWQKWYPWMKYMR
jgi:mannose-6-phosphate isomerase-like protein (cupin superfamily)